VGLIVGGRAETVGPLEEILEHLETLLGPLSGEPVALAGGITNRNYRVTLGDADYVIRQPGNDTELLGIDRESECLATEAAASLGIAPAVVAMLDECLVTRFIDCRPVGTRELVDGVEQIASALRGFHDSSVLLPTRFRVPDLLRDYAAVIRDRGGTLPADYAQAETACQRIGDALGPAGARPCHNDLLAGNLVRAEDADGRMMILDWEYAGMGDPRFDLGNLSINCDFDEATDDRLLRAYGGHAPGDGERAALKLMRVLSDAREAAWGAVQAQISELDFDFEGYACAHFERLRATVGQPDFEDWLAGASA